MDCATDTPLVRASQLLEDNARAPDTGGTEDSRGSRRRLGNLLGRLTEITGPARLTAITPYVREAQQSGHAVAWITTSNSLFYPLDFEKNGIRVENIPIVRAYTAEQAASDSHNSDAGTPGSRLQAQYESTVRAMRAADTLLRTSAFILIVLDLTNARPKQASLGKLLRLANGNDIAVVALTTGQPYLGSLVSLRIRAEYVPIGQECGNGNAFPGSADGPRPGMQSSRFFSPKQKVCGATAKSRENLRITLTAVKDKQGGPYWSTEEVFLAPNGMR